MDFPVFLRLSIIDFFQKAFRRLSQHYTCDMLSFYGYCSTSITKLHKTLRKCCSFTMLQNILNDLKIAYLFRIGGFPSKNMKSSKIDQVLKNRMKIGKNLTVRFETLACSVQIYFSSIIQCAILHKRGAALDMSLTMMICNVIDNLPPRGHVVRVGR